MNKKSEQRIKAKQRKENDIAGYKRYLEGKLEDENEFEGIDNEFDEQKERERTQNLKASEIAPAIFTAYLNNKGYEARKNIITELELLHLKKKCDYDNTINRLLAMLKNTKNRRTKKSIEAKIREVNNKYYENAGIVRTYITQDGDVNAYVNMDYSSLKEYVSLMKKAKSKGIKLAFGSHKLASNLQKHGAGYSNNTNRRNKDKKRLSNKIYGWLNPEIKKKHKKKK